MAAAPPRWGPPAFYDQRRTKEFHRYYEAVRALVPGNPSWTDLHDNDAVARHRPVPSPDKALTAFCQLAAVKLNAKRAMLFFFDSENGYVLAEATQSSSLGNGPHEQDKDQLWLGYTTIPRGFSVCEHTVNLPENTGSNRETSSSHVVHIINDLSGDVRFCNRPFVTDGPKARFYAGVPITTPTGLNIGALCALDDQPREATSDHEIDLLRDLASAVMSHIEGLRAKADAQTCQKLLGSLTTFADGVAVLGETDESPASLVFRPVPARRPSHFAKTRRHPMSLASDSRLEDDDSDEASETTDLPGPSDVSANLGSVSHHSDNPGSAGTKPHAEEVVLCPATQINEAEEHAQRVFQLAAATIHKAMDVDGVIFYDASSMVSSKTTGVYSQNTTYPTSSETNTGNDEVPADNERDANNNLNASRDAPCPLLATASSERAKMQDVPAKDQMTGRFLRSLIRRYENGKIWHPALDDFSSEDSSSSRSTLAAEDRETASVPKPRRRRQVNERATLEQMIPGAQTVMFLPIWDQSSGKWCAGAVLYSYSPLRIFSVDVELRFTRAFCDVVIAELGRLDVKSLSLAKSTFVSSISHELRTPLHGILGSVEFLHDQDLDTGAALMVSQIESCAVTMLDIVNHILDFSGINQLLHRTYSDASNDTEQRSTVKPLSDKPRAPPMMDLDRMTESVCESAIYSYYCRAALSQQEAPRVITTLEVERHLQMDWVCQLSIGSWKRICINLIINALKYTEYGHIRISLHQKPPQTKGEKSVAVFTVEDTGRGMSKDFMSSLLFRPFEQEDVMSDGLGLGLSLVVKLVKSIEGEINIRSTQGVGTRVTVTVPLIQKRANAPERSSTDSNNAAADSQPRKWIGMDYLGQSWTTDEGSAYGKGRRILRASLQKSIDQICVHRLSDHLDWTDAEVNITLEDDLAWVLASARDHIAAPAGTLAREKLSKPYIVICKTYHSMRQCRPAVQTLRETLGLHVEFVMEPCGTFALARAVSACLRAIESPLQVPPQLSQRDSSSSLPRRPRLGRRTSSNNTIKHASRPDSAHGQRPRLLSQRNKATTTESFSEDSMDHREQRQQHTAPPSNREQPPATVEEPSPQATTSSSAHQIEFPPTPALTPPASFETYNASAQDGSPPNRLSPTRKTPVVPAPTNCSPPAMLLVDDNEINLRLLLMYAEKRKHSHRTAFNGLLAYEDYREALLAELASSTDLRDQDAAKAEKNRPTRHRETEQQPVTPDETQNPKTDDAVPQCWPQVIVMDINMPIMDGFESTRCIRALESRTGGRRRAYIIAMTGLGSEAARREAKESGMDLFLTRPVRLKELTNVLEGKPWTE